MIFVIQRNNVKFLLQVSFFVLLASTTVQSSFATNIKGKEESQSWSWFSFAKTVIPPLFTLGSYVKREYHRNLVKVHRTNLGNLRTDAIRKPKWLDEPSEKEIAESIEFSVKNGVIRDESKIVDMHLRNALQSVMKKNMLTLVGSDSAEALVFKNFLHISFGHNIGATIADQIHALSRIMTQDAIITILDNNEWHYSIDSGHYQEINNCYEQFVSKEQLTQQLLLESHELSAKGWHFGVVVGGAITAGVGAKSVWDRVYSPTSVINRDSLLITR